MSQRKFKRCQRAATLAATAKPAVQSSQPCLQALVWYREEHWSRLRELFPDAYLLPKTYQDWLSRAEAKKNEVQTAGDVAIKVFIDPESFPVWCQENGMVMDAAARAQFALEVVQAQSFSL